MRNDGESWDPVLEPGNYVLRVEGKGVRPAETPVFIDAGRIVDAEVSVDPQ